MDFKAGASAYEVASALDEARVDGVSELGRDAIEGVTVAARDQVILDAYGGIDRMAEQADIMLWQRVA